jgi:hypothetical protein
VAIETRIEWTLESDSMNESLGHSLSHSDSPGVVSGISSSHQMGRQSRRSRRARAGEAHSGRMRRRRRVLPLLGLFVAWASSHEIASANSLDDGSRACQVCHGIEDWLINDPVAKRTTNLSIDTDAYLGSSHGSLGCTTCHEPGYSVLLPHRGSGAQPLYLCVVCHDDDDKLEWLHLPTRRAQLRKSAHGSTDQGPVDCHSCHDPHTFRPVNDSLDALRRIELSNAICLDCHGPESARRSHLDRPDTRPSHDLFPNYDNHLRKVKCIACHTADPDSTHHDITHKDLAIRECAKCHAPTSSILDIVYGPQRAEQNNSLVDDAYVIGSNRSPRLERLSVTLFVSLLGAISLHGVLRVLHSSKGKSTDES